MSLEKYDTYNEYKLSVELKGFDEQAWMNAANIIDTVLLRVDIPLY